MTENQFTMLATGAAVAEVLFAVACVALGKTFGVREARQEAIDAGVARWDVDPKTGERRYRYVTK